jgi:preprotein translocase subunit SecG
MGPLFAIILTLLAIFLILLVLVQRGRGGGLAGALGGMGGSSAFGAKAGDVFTRITIITASIWIVISIIAFFWAKNRGDRLGGSDALSGSSDRPLSSAPLDAAKEPSKSGDTSAATTAAPAAKSDAPADTGAATDADDAEAFDTATQKLESGNDNDTPPPADETTK